MKIGFLQYKPELGKIENNIKKIESFFIELKLAGDTADLIVLPELAFSGYNFEDRKQLEECADQVIELSLPFLVDCAEKYNISIISGLAYKSKGNIYNSAIIVKPDRSYSLYNKTHLFGREKILFDKSKPEFLIEEINGVKVGVLICFDHMFPEVARVLALRGAQIIAHPSNLVLPGIAQKTTLVRAIENRVFWILADRTGEEGDGDKKLVYSGESRIFSPDGDVLVSADAVEEGLFIVKINPEKALNKQVGLYNDLFQDRYKSFDR